MAQQQQAPPLVAAYVRRLRGGSPAQRTQAAAALRSTLGELAGTHSERFEAAAAAVVANGGVALVQLVRSGSDEALRLLGSLATGSANRAQAILATGAVPPMVQCLSTGLGATQQEAAWGAAGAGVGRGRAGRRVGAL